MTQRIMTYVTLLIFTVGNAGLGHTAEFSNGKSREKNGGRSLERVMQADKAAQNRAKARRHMRRMSRSLKNLGHRVDRASHLSKSKQRAIRARIRDMSGKTQKAKKSQEPKGLKRDNQKVVHGGLGISGPVRPTVPSKPIPLPTPIKPIKRPPSLLGSLESQYVAFPNEVLAQTVFGKKPDRHTITKTDVRGFAHQIRVDYYDKKGKLLGTQHLTLVPARKTKTSNSTWGSQKKTYIQEKWKNAKGKTLYKAKTQIVNNTKVNLVSVRGKEEWRTTSVQKPEGKRGEKYVSTKGLLKKASLIFGTSVASRKLVSVMSTANTTVMTWKYYDKRGKALGTHQERSSQPSPGMKKPLNKKTSSETWMDKRGNTLFQVNKREHFLVRFARWEKKTPPFGGNIGKPPYVPLKTKS